MAPPPAGTRRIRVLIVDDSLFMRAAIAKALASGPFEVVGQAKDGADALVQVGKLAPDVITMDFNMPGMNGADTVRALMQQRPTPVVMFSAHTKQGAKETFDALAAGAVDFVTKPAGEVSVDLSKIADELTRKLLVAASARPRAATPVLATRPSGAIGVSRSTVTGGLPRLCVIAVSTGGPAALSEVIPALPSDLRLAIVVVQHMPAGFTSALAERLDAASRVSVREAQTGDRPLPGSVLIAPGDRHLEFDDRGMVTLTAGPLVNGCRPAADITMLSAVKVYGRRTLAVVMTGMGKDGAAGALAIKKAEGKTCAQDQLTSVIYGMPKAAVEAGAIDEVLPLADLAGWLRYA
ncbi:MAG: chemotaxis response regulator protein-glutamate methylesterase [Deltaproteobacteria bacterium]|nr:chemotaxis response regulator protein-glutamate methylesterase [Deltaproteobacteria bacterium]